MHMVELTENHTGGGTFTVSGPWSIRVKRKNQLTILQPSLASETLYLNALLGKGLVYCINQHRISVQNLEEHTLVVLLMGDLWFYYSE